MTLAITAQYATILAMLWFVLNISVSILRGKSKIALSDGGDAKLLEAIRRDANFAEAVPLALILLALGEAGGLSSTWLHASGLILLASRLIHPFGISASKPDHPLRIVGAVGTKIAMLIPMVAIAANTFAG